jgi:hypothetical protein
VRRTKLVIRPHCIVVVTYTHVWYSWRTTAKGELLFKQRNRRDETKREWMEGSAEECVTPDDRGDNRYITKKIRKILEKRLWTFSSPMSWERCLIHPLQRTMAIVVRIPARKAIIGKVCPTV